MQATERNEPYCAGWICSTENVNHSISSWVCSKAVPILIKVDSASHTYAYPAFASPVIRSQYIWTKQTHLCKENGLLKFDFLEFQ